MADIDNGTQNPTDANPYDLDKIDPAQLPEEMQQIYNNMLTDYRAKTTIAADMRKEAEAIQRQNAELQAQMQQQQQSLQQYEQYYQQAAPLLQQYLAQQQQQQPGQQDADPGYGDYMDDAVAKRYDQRIAQLEQQLQQQAQTVQAYANQFAATLGLQEQLGSLRSTHHDIDPARVFETAKALNTPNLEAAYKIAYFDEAREAYAKELVEKREKELRDEFAQQQANNAIPPGSPGGGFPSQSRTVLQPTQSDGGRISWNRAREEAAKALGGLV